MAFPPKMGKEPGTKGLANKPPVKPASATTPQKSSPKPKPGGKGMAIGQKPVMPKTMRKMQKMMGQ